MRKGKKIIAGMLTGMAVVLAGCGSSDDGGVKQTNQSLSLCVDESMNHRYEDVFEQYRKTYPDVELNVEVYEGIILAGVDKINTQIMAGEGPDLLLMQSYGTSDVYKMMQANAFAPLDAFMEKDSDWDADQYIRAVVETGRYEDRQMAMPLNFYMPIALTTQENLKKAEISLESCQDVAQFLEEVVKFKETGGMERVFMEPGQLSMYPEYVSHQFLDYGRGTSGIGEQKLRQACEAYKRFYTEDTELCDLPDTLWYGFGEMVAQGEAGMYIPNSSRSFLAAAQVAAASATPVIWPFQNETGETMATVREYAAIRANSENCQNAWNLIKMLLKEPAQIKMAKEGMSYPILRSAVETAVRQAQEETFEEGSSEMEMAQLPEQLIQQYIDVLQNPEHGIFITSMSTKKFADYMKPFYEDTASYEDCIGEFKKFIQVYLTE